MKDFTKAHSTRTASLGGKLAVLLIMSSLGGATASTLVDVLAHISISVDDNVKITPHNTTLGSKGLLPTVKPTEKPTQTPPTVTPSTSPTQGTKSQTDQYCLTAGCVEAAAKVNSALDTSINPCDDFFQYSCGAWNLRHPIPEDKGTVSTFGVLNDELIVHLKGLLEKPPVANEADAIKKARTLYRSCLNEEEINRDGVHDLMAALGELGKWPVVDNNSWTDTGFDFTDVITKADSLNAAHILSTYVTRDSRQSSKYIIMIDQPRLGMPSREYFLRGRNDTHLVAYQHYISAIATMLATEMGFNFNEQDVVDMIDFEIELANITAKPEDMRDSNKLYNPVVLKFLQLTYPSTKLDWSRYLKGMFAPVQIYLSDEERMIIAEKAFYHNLMTLIDKTANRTLANYIGWRYVQSQVTALPQRYRDLYGGYAKVVFGTHSAPARWHTCVSTVNRNLGHATGRLYIDNVFSKEAKATANTLIQSIRTEFEKLLATELWLDDATRKVAKDKADAVLPKIGYPEYIMDDAKLDAKYTNLTLTWTSYMANLLAVSKFKSKRNAYKLGEVPKRSEWGTTAAVVNAFYQPTRNDISFPAGILQPPFYSHGYPMSMNFGAIGVVIGHELTHGFDDEGRQYDKYGDLSDWWSLKIVDNFKAQAKCMIDQYSGFYSPEAHMYMNGERTQGENIADNGGLNEAFYAYQDWVAKNGPELKLPGTNFTHNQLFFLGFSQVWCGNIRRATAENRIVSDPHSPGRFRVWGVMQNSKEFSEAFQCKPYERMNPPMNKKCKVW